MTLSDNGPNRRDRAAWAKIHIPPFLWLALLAAGALYAPDARRWLDGLRGPGAFAEAAMWGSAGALLLGALALAFIAQKASRAPRLSPARWVALMFIALAYVANLASLARAGRAIEAAHFFLFSALAWLFLRRERAISGDISAYPRAVLSAAACGILDEWLQWLLPERVGALEDMLTDALAAGLAVAAIYAGQGQSANDPIHPPAWRRLAGPFALCAGLFALSAANTPALRPSLPPGVARFIADCEPMNEWVYRLPDGDGFAAKSRLSPAALARADREYGDFWGETLARDLRLPYPDFLRLHPAAREPFLYELRVRLFRRDRYYANGAADMAQRAEAWHIAAWENQILERYFANALRASGTGWSSAIKRETDNWRRPGYTSPVAADGLAGVWRWPIYASAVLAFLVWSGVVFAGFIRQNYAAPK